MFIYFMAILMKLATCHVRNTFERPLRPNAPTVRVLTSVILKGIGWAFRKLYPTKIPGMVHQGLLAPQRLMFFNTCHLLGYFFCGQSMRMLFICGESPIFSDQIGIKIIAVRRTVI